MRRGKSRQNTEIAFFNSLLIFLFVQTKGGQIDSNINNIDINEDYWYD